MHRKLPVPADGRRLLLQRLRGCRVQLGRCNKMQRPALIARVRHTIHFIRELNKVIPESRYRQPPSSGIPHGSD